MAGRMVAWWRKVGRVLVNPARYAPELFLLLLCGFSGATGLLAPRVVATSPLSGLPDIVATAWYAGLWGGATIAIVGIFMSRPLGPLVERAGLLMLTGLALSFSALLIGIGSPAAGGLVSVLLLFALTLLARIWLIGREPKEIKAAIDLLTGNDNGGEQP